MEVGDEGCSSSLRILTCPVWEGIKGGGGSCGVQFPDALKDLLLCHLFHTEWSVAIDGVRDERLVPLGEWVLLD